MIPLIRKGEELWLIEPPTSETDVAFTWNPKPTEPPPPLRILDVVPSWHTYGYELFKPSIQECKDALPSRYADIEELYFEVFGPQDVEDLNVRGCTGTHKGRTQDSTHLACIVLYIPRDT